MPIPKAPTPSLQDAERVQIEDLVQRNRRLTTDITRLEEQVAQKDLHAQQMVNQAQDRLQKVNEEWRDGLDIVQTCHRLAELRAADELEKERMAILLEQNETRREKVARLQRDYKLTLFQMTESELTSRIDELEEDFAALQSQYTQLQTENKRLQARANARQKEIQTLQEQTAETRAETEGLNAKLERTVLQLETAHTRIKELERSLDEIKVNNSDLQRQLNRWQQLENKGDSEIQTLRKKRVELEVSLQALQRQLKRKDEDEGKLLEAEKEKNKKYKAGVKEWMAAVRDRDDDIAERDREIDALKAQLKAARGGSKPPPSKGGKRGKTTQKEETEASDSAPEEPEPRRSKPTPTPTAKPKKPRAPSVAADSEVEEAPQPKATSSKTTKKRQAAKRQATDSEAEPKSRKGKAKAVDNDDEMDVDAGPNQDDDASDNEPDEPVTLGKRKKAPTSSSSRKPLSKVNPPSRQTSVARDNPPKTRKLFTPASAFNWGALNPGQNTLGIPTDVSPVKDGGTSGVSALGAFANLISQSSRSK